MTKLWQMAALVLCGLALTGCSFLNCTLDVEKKSAGFYVYEGDCLVQK